MGDSIVRLRCAERPYVKPEPVQLLQVLLGTDISKNVIGPAMDDISKQLDQLENAYLKRNYSTVQCLARSLTTAGKKIGLEGFAKVAKDLSVCAGARDAVAIDAVAARLLRLGGESLIRLRKFADTGD